MGGFELSGPTKKIQYVYTSSSRCLCSGLTLTISQEEEDNFVGIAKIESIEKLRKLGWLAFVDRAEYRYFSVIRHAQVTILKEELFEYNKELVKSKMNTIFNKSDFKGYLHP